ncbi:transcriptional regulator, ArsR family [Pedococcus dokdonensis]|uniref:Transcriptional regulator, ArsR family n=1 Tax=Pedococcus dokdonensis TaxID=443156 RepID=A0A1H0SNR2_9MICO|nr:transcriptional regulator, ArsR family [Pedococcus dokdonensis]
MPPGTCTIRTVNTTVKGTPVPQLTATPRDITSSEAASYGSLTDEEAMPRDRAEATATLLKAVADPVRLQLLSLIRATKNHEACVCDLTPAVGLSQPTVSHHLKVLTEAGLVTRERRGTWAWFQLVPSRLDDLAAIFV